MQHRVRDRASAASRTSSSSSPRVAGSRALAEALAVSERRAQKSSAASWMRYARAADAVFQAPPLPWVEERVARLQEVLERRTEKSGLLLRKVLGPIKLVPTQGDIGRPYYRAVTNLQVLALLEDDPDEPPSSGGSEGGSRPLRWWRRRPPTCCPMSSTLVQLLQ